MNDKDHKTWSYGGREYLSKEYPSEGVGWMAFPDDAVELHENSIARLRSMNRKTADESRVGDEDSQPTEWMQQPWVRVRESENPEEAILLQAARETRPVWIRYSGGSAGGRKRQILPAMLFRSEEEVLDSWDPCYVIACCALRQATRLFRDDRIESVAPCRGSSPGRFPLYRALGEIEEELRTRYHFEGDEIERIDFGGNSPAVPFPTENRQTENR